MPSTSSTSSAGRVRAHKFRPLVMFAHELPFDHDSMLAKESRNVRMTVGFREIQRCSAYEVSGADVRSSLNQEFDKRPVTSHASQM